MKTIDQLQAKEIATIQRTVEENPGYQELSGNQIRRVINLKLIAAGLPVQF
jgi:hypothetical protein